MVFILGTSISILQIKTRDYDFNYTGHTLNYQEYELKSKEKQKEILGDKLYELIVKFDDKLGINF